MTPLVLLVLLAFFLAIALTFLVWVALTMDQRIRRAAHSQTVVAPPGAGESHKPWERAPAPAPERGRRQPGRVPAQQQQVVQASLWERQPLAPPEPRGGKRGHARQGSSEADTGQVVITPRQPNTDAFERFLESEKRRD